MRHPCRYRLSRYHPLWLNQVRLLSKNLLTLLAKTGREFHLSGGYQFAGPGTQLQKRLALGSQTIGEYFGLAKCTILPPTELYHPVLRYHEQGKLTFPLCRRARRNGETAQRETSGVSSHGRGVRVAWNMVYA